MGEQELFDAILTVTPAPDTLTLEQALEGLRGLGIARLAEGQGADERRAECPLCSKRNGLVIATDAFGALTLACEDGCPGDAVVARLRGGLRALEVAREDPLEHVRSTLGEPGLERILKHGRGGDMYVLEYEDGDTVTIGTPASLLSQAKFRAAYLPARRRLPRTLTKGAWDRFVECVERSAEQLDNVSTASEETEDWLDAYGRRAVELDLADARQLHDHMRSSGDAPFRAGGRLHVRPDDLARFLHQTQRAQLTQREVSARLSAAGYRSMAKTTRVNGRPAGKRYWIEGGAEVTGADGSETEAA